MNPTGKVTIPKNALEHDFLNRQPANYKSAFADLWAWANDRPRTIEVGTGRALKLARGQLAYAQTTLAKLWRWSVEKVKAFLIELQNEGLITFDCSNTTTIITVLDYTIYNADSTPEPATKTATESGTETGIEPGTASATKSAQKLEVGSKKGEARDPQFDEIAVPGLGEYIASCSVRGIPEAIARKDHAWRSEQPSRRWPTAHWQTAVTSLFERWRDSGAPGGNFGKKNGAANLEKTGSRERGEILQALSLARAQKNAAEIEQLEKELRAA